MIPPVATFKAANSDVVPCRVARVAFRTIRFQGEQRLSAVQGLDLALLIDA
jgi:hypothetical protein